MGRKIYKVIANCSDIIGCIDYYVAAYNCSQAVKYVEKQPNTKAERVDLLIKSKSIIVPIEEDPFLKKESR